jgi:hypothetical protein
MRHPPGVRHLRASRSIPAQCLRCASDRTWGAGIMTRLRIASQFVAVVAGAYAALMLIGGQLIDFGVAAAICAVSTVAAGLIACAGGRRRQVVAPGPAAVCEGRDQQAATVTDEQCTLCGGARQKLSDSPRFVNRQSARHACRPSTQSRHDEPAAGLGASSDGLSNANGCADGRRARLGVTNDRFGCSASRTATWRSSGHESWACYPLSDSCPIQADRTSSRGANNPAVITRVNQPHG